MAGEHQKLRDNIDYIKSHTVQETADYLGINKSTVRKFINALEIPYVRQRYPEPEYTMEILEYTKHNSVKKAMEKYNVTRDQIGRWAQKHNFSIRNTDRTNFFHGIPIEVLVEEVNESSLRAVAKKYGVTYQRVHNVLTRAGYEWRYVKTR